jgi:hypothetical protein
VFFFSVVRAEERLTTEHLPRSVYLRGASLTELVRLSSAMLHGT